MALRLALTSALELLLAHTNIYTSCILIHCLIEVATDTHVQCAVAGSSFVVYLYDMNTHQQLAALGPGFVIACKWFWCILNMVVPLLQSCRPIQTHHHYDVSQSIFSHVAWLSRQQHTQRSHARSLHRLHGSQADPEGHTNRVFSVCMDPIDTNLIYTAGWDNTVQVAGHIRLCVHVVRCYIYIYYDTRTVRQSDSNNAGYVANP